MSFIGLRNSLKKDDQTMIENFLRALGKDLNYGDTRWSVSPDDVSFFRNALMCLTTMVSIVFLTLERVEAILSKCVIDPI
jgi:hypothetical protein